MVQTSFKDMDGCECMKTFMMTSSALKNGSF